MTWPTFALTTSGTLGSLSDRFRRRRRRQARRCAPMPIFGSGKFIDALAEVLVDARLQEAAHQERVDRYPDLVR
jgi:hypothetical protein